MRNQLRLFLAALFVMAAAIAPCQQSRNGNNNINANDNQTTQPDDEFDNALVPGASGCVMTFFGAGRPLMVGGSLRYDLLYTLEKSNPDASFLDRGRNELYLDIGFYGSIPTGPASPVFLFHYLVGLTTSFETPRSMDRAFLIPYMGIELGGIYIQDVGHGFLAVPVLGLNIVTTPSVTVSIDTGLILNTASFMDYLGLRNEIHVNFVL
jgi:hypothetical protein